MLLTASLLAVWSLLATAVQADFWLSEWDRSFESGYVFTPDHPQYCTPELGNAPEYWGSNDVSGDKYGVRFEGIWDDPEVVEFNTVELVHHSKSPRASLPRPGSLYRLLSYVLFFVHGEVCLWERLHECCIGN